MIAAFSAQLGGPGMRLALTTGGTLTELAEAHDLPLIAYDFDGPPRTAFGYSVLPLLEVLRRLGVVDLDDDAVERALHGLERCAEAWGPQQPTASNAAKQIALRLRDRLPYVVGGDVLAVAARRWAGQLAENAKQWAFAGALPEFDHNTIVALDRRQEASRELHVVLLEGAAVAARNRLRAQLTAAELAAAGVDCEIVSIEADDPLGAVLEACQLGDWVSYYAALLHGVDPLPTPILDRVKGAMADAGRRVAAIPHARYRDPASMFIAAQRQLAILLPALLAATLALACTSADEPARTPGFYAEVAVEVEPRPTTRSLASVSPRAGASSAGGTPPTRFAGAGKSKPSAPSSTTAWP